MLFFIFVVLAFILSRVDYCNIVLACLPTSAVAPLQRVLNTAARFVAGVTSRTDVSDIIKSVHWLPISYRARFKFCVLMHGVHNGTSHFYLTDTTTPISSLLRHRRLRSSMTTEYDIPRTMIKSGDRAFSVAGSHEWNALSVDIRNITDLSSFKRAIKTLFLYCIFGLIQLYFSRLYYVRHF